jgi:hypothetical protein
MSRKRPNEENVRTLFCNKSYIYLFDVFQRVLFRFGNETVHESDIRSLNDSLNDVVMNVYTRF